MKKHPKIKDSKRTEEFHQELKEDCQHINSEHRDGCIIGYMYCLDCDCPVPTPMVIETLLEKVFWRERFLRRHRETKQKD